MQQRARILQGCKQVSRKGSSLGNENTQILNLVQYQL